MRAGYLAGLAVVALVGFGPQATAQFYSGSSGGWGSGTSSASLTTGAGQASGAGGYCDQNIAQHQQEARLKDIEDRTAIARANYSDMPSSGFFGASCIQNLLTGLNLIFQPPNFSALQAQLMAMACNAVRGYVDQARQEVVGQIRQASTSVSLPMGNIIPGVNLGSLGAGVDVSLNGGQNGNVNTNITSIFSQADGGFGLQDYYNGSGRSFGTTIFGR